MARMSSALLCLVLLVQPLGAQQQAVVAKMRDAALNYADRLQDFLCVESLVRTVDSSGSGKKWKLLESREVEVGYIGHKEHYRLLSVNGKAADAEKRIKRGYWNPGGQFGTALLLIFAPKAAAEFEWDHEETSDGKQSCVFRYKVPLATTTYGVQADLDHVKLGHHGYVTADCETGAVRRIQIETEPGSVKRHGQSLAVGMQMDVRYGPVRIGANEFLLPERSVEIAPFGKTLTKVEIQFGQYRKYDSNSKITFDDGK